MNISYSHVPIILDGIMLMDTKTLEATEISNLLKTKKYFQSISDNIADTQKLIFKDYDVVSVNNQYSWANHPDASEITTKINNLLSTNVDFNVEHPMDENRFYSSVKGLSMLQIELLSQILI